MGEDSNNMLVTMPMCPQIRMVPHLDAVGLGLSPLPSAWTAQHPRAPGSWTCGDSLQLPVLRIQSN